MISSALLPSAQSASERRTPTNALASGSPNASRMRGAASKFAICSSVVCAKRWMPRASRSSGVQPPGSSRDLLGQLQAVLDAAEPAGDHRGQSEVGVAGGVGGLELDVRVLRADRLGARHEAQGGLAVVGAPEARRRSRSSRAAGGSARARSGRSRRRRPGGRAGCRRRTPRPRRVMPSGPSPPESRLRPSLSSERWKCQPLPTPSGVISGANDARRPLARAARADRLAREQLVVGGRQRITWRRARARAATSRTRRGSGRCRGRWRRGRRAARRGTRSRRASRSGCRPGRGARRPARRSPGR